MNTAKLPMVGDKVQCNYETGIVQRVFLLNGTWKASVKWMMPKRHDGRRGTRPPVAFESVVTVDNLSIIH
jgi:hypothetical protein